MSMIFRKRSVSIASAAAVLACATLLPEGAASAQFDLPGDGPRVQSAADVSSVRVLTDRSSVAPAETFNLVVFFETQPRWHVYWKNPGEGAAAPDVRVKAPEGFEVGEVRWPRPKIVASPIGDLYCLDGRTALFVPITAPNQMSDGAAEFTVDLGYAVCDSQKCFFGRASLKASVTNSVATNGSTVDEDPLIERHRKRLSTLVADSNEASAQIVGDGDSHRLVVTGPAHGLSDGIFFPYNSPGVRYGKPEITFDDDRFTATVELTINRTNFTRGAPRVGGLIALGSKLDDPSYEVDLPLESPTKAAAKE